MIPSRQPTQPEADGLIPAAMRVAATRGRRHAEPEHPFRRPFQRDRDRIIHAAAFRRLEYKTQVFVNGEGDHYRTRLTHTLEVNQIARTVARALGLNEDLAEAVALSHDLGHTPFGHAGEATLNQLLPQGFHHWQQSLRVVDHLERDGRGLNLTYEVRMGIWGHSKGRKNFLDLPDHIDQLTLEAQLVRAADIMAYVAHDADDAIRGGIISAQELPEEVRQTLGLRLSQQIGAMVRDLIEQTAGSNAGIIKMSPMVSDSIMILRDFLYKRVYDNLEVHNDFIKASKLVRELFGELMANDAFFQAQIGVSPEGVDRQQMAVDYVAGMTDSYALLLYQSHFMPRPWTRL